MRFFVPHASDANEAESVYGAVAKFVGAAVPTEKSARIQALSWQHNGRDFASAVGDPMPRYYELDNEPILAIFNCGDHFKICTPSRGGLRGDPIMASMQGSRATYFEGWNGTGKLHAKVSSDEAGRWRPVRRHCNIYFNMAYV